MKDNRTQPFTHKTENVHSTSRIDEVIKFFKDNHRWSGINKDIVNKDAEILRRKISYLIESKCKSCQK
jgi:hypothetical protein